MLYCCTVPFSGIVWHSNICFLVLIFAELILPNKNSLHLFVCWNTNVMFLIDGHWTWHVFLVYLFVFYWNICSDSVKSISCDLISMSLFVYALSLSYFSVCRVWTPVKNFSIWLPSVEKAGDYFLPSNRQNLFSYLYLQPSVLPITEDSLENTSVSEVFSYSLGTYLLWVISGTQSH